MADDCNWPEHRAVIALKVWGFAEKPLADREYPDNVNGSSIDIDTKLDQGLAPGLSIWALRRSISRSFSASCCFNRSISP